MHRSFRMIFIKDQQGVFLCLITRYRPRICSFFSHALSCDQLRYDPGNLKDRLPLTR